MVLTGNRSDEVFKALKTNSSLTALNSNIIFPARKGKIFSVGLPFPLPILTSRGFRVNDQKGNALIIKKFFFFITLLMDFIVAESCSVVKLQLPSDFRPHSPKCIESY